MKINDLYTVEGENLSGIPHNYYPRPQMRRNSFFCLNGEWDFYERIDAPCEKITVPFCPESLLSGIGRRLGKCPAPVYQKRFTLPENFIKSRVILHFGAVDQYASVFLNGKEIGEHAGGYESFSFDITDAIMSENELTVYVFDELDTAVLPYGKQKEKRGGMWYTPVTGIWQTVWLESVPEKYIESLEIKTVNDTAIIKVNAISNGEVICEGKVFPIVNGAATVKIDTPEYWSPENPRLYNFTVIAGEDEVQSYFALRTLEIKRVDGILRLCLNGKPYFFHGLLDQGYFPDGIFTPATEKGFENDILAMKELGFNMLRKHIKVEPEQFYYDCDRLGMVVFQDMVNNGKYSFFRDTALPTIGMKRFPNFLLHRSKETKVAFIDGMKSTVRQLQNHPCICYWTIFNEGWGQFDADKVFEIMKEIDSSRFIDATSGWFTGKKSDVTSLHVYFKPVKIKKSDKPTVLSEFGGYSYKLDEHSFNLDKTYGYKKFDDGALFMDALEKLYENEVIPLVKEGLCASVYTQVSDVEDETNGLYTYDRRVLKVDKERMKNIAAKLKI